MSETKFTHGPWHLSGNQVWSTRDSITESELIADCELTQGSFDLDVCSANAHLIAAAPEMYAALVEALRVAPCNADEDDELAAFYAQVRSVLAEARGKA